MQIKNFFEKVAIVIAVLIGSFALVLVLAIILINISLKPKPSPEAKQVVLADTGDEYLIDIVPSIKEGEFYELFGQRKHDLIGESDRLLLGDARTVISIHSDSFETSYYYKPASNELFNARTTCAANILNEKLYTNHDLAFQLNLPSGLNEISEVETVNQQKWKPVLIKGYTKLCGALPLEYSIQIEKLEYLGTKTVSVKNDSTMEDYMLEKYPRNEVFDNGKVKLFITGTSHRPAAPQPYEAWAVESAGNIYKIKFNEYFDNIENVKTILSTFQFL